MRKQQLERALESVAEFPSPDPRLEQYRTPPGVAADLLWEAKDDGAIAGCRVADLGCGTGTFAHGAHLLGASDVVGVDVDSTAIQLAQALVPKARFVCSELSVWTPTPADTVLMNPPFGAQHKGADRIFYEKAFATGASSIWFLAQPTTQGYLVAMAREFGTGLEKVAEWDYPLVATMEHHADAVRTVRVGGYRMG